jgi:hypothetical protein
MKMRVLIGCVLIIVTTHVRAGDLSIIGNVSIATNLAVGADQGFKWDSTNGVQVTLPSSLSRTLAMQVNCNATNFYGNDAIGLFAPNGSLKWLVGMVMPDAYFRIYSHTLGADAFRISYDGGYFHASVFPDSCGDQEFDIRGNEVVSGDLEVGGKINALGGMDPPYLLLDSETRSSIARRVAREVPSSKQTGAALFWNSQTKRLEIYVASEGAFYNLAGNAITNITPPTIAGAVVTRRLTIDADTGAIVTNENQRVPRWQLKSGYKFDRATGQFTYQASSNAPPVAVTRDQAIELR